MNRSPFGHAERLLTPTLLLSAAIALSSCGQLPRDSADSLSRIRSGALRVGVADHPPWVVFEGDRVSGLEPELIERWARQLGAEVRYRRGAEAELVEALDRRELDVVAAGYERRTPYAPQMALTQPYLTVRDEEGSRRQHVLAVTPGESALLFALDRFLATQDEAALRGRLSQLLREVRR